MTWQIYAGISIFTYSLAVMVQKLFLKDKGSDPVAYTIIVQLLIAVLCGVIVLISGLDFPQLSLQILFSLVIMALAYALGSIASFTALKMIEASEYSILIFTKTFWSVALAVLILNEPFGALRLAGTILIFLSIILALWKGQRIKLEKGEFFALTAAFLLGAAFINDAILLQSLNVWIFLLLGFLLPPLTIFIIMPKSSYQTAKLITGKNYWKPILMGLLFFGSAITTYLALETGRNPGQLAAISPVAVIVIVIFSAIFLKERDNLIRKIIASITCFIGVILVS